MNNQIKMVAMDFDMTLVDHSELGVQIPEQTKELLTSLINQGVDAGIISGRHWWEMKEILEKTGMKWGDPFPSFFITREALIYRLQGNEMIPDEEWNKNKTRGITDFTRNLAGRVSLIMDLLAANGLYAARWILYSDYALELFFGNEEEAEAARILIQSSNVSDINGKVHRNRSVANVIFSEIGKGKTLLHLAKSTNLLPEQVLAIGDSLNDMDMLDGQLGFTCGAVGNAALLIKDAVNKANGMVAVQRTGWGVAEIILEHKKRGRFPC